MNFGSVVCYSSNTPEIPGQWGCERGGAARNLLWWQQRRGQRTQSAKITLSVSLSVVLLAPPPPPIKLISSVIEDDAKFGRS